MNTPDTATPPAFPSPASTSTPAFNAIKKKNGEEFRDYPFLNHDEFTEVCHDFDRIYRQATLGPVRRRWRASVNVAFNTSFAAGDRDFTTFLQISRPLENSAGEQDDELSGVLDKFSFGDDDADMSEDMIAAEEADDAALAPTPSRMPDYGYVTYEIHLHPTYRAPCLWFSLHNLPNDEPAFSIDAVFRHLVPSQFQDTLRSMGSIGGISADYHPVTGVPSFFVHPCLLGEAISGFDCTKKSYLMVWLGLVGGCVGLWVPKEMALL